MSVTWRAIGGNGRRRSAATVAACALLALPAACGRRAEPRRAVLDDFLDAYVRRADPGAARAFADGMARTRLDEEVAAAAGQPRPPSGPDVTFEITGTTALHDTTVYEIALHIGKESGAGFARDLLVHVAPRDGTPRVVDFLFLR